MIDELVDLVDGRWREPAPFVVGIAGGVGVGKTTMAAGLADGLRARGRSVAVVATDNFLFPNDELGRRGLLMQKGFPDTYDVAALQHAIEELRARHIAVVPVYSHQVYDRVDEVTSIPPSDVLIVEGVNVLQPDVAAVLDLALYIDVDEAHAKTWFFRRFEELCRTGEGFYASFAAMTSDERSAIADSAWSGINLVNLVEHIEPTRARAHVVVTKDADHTIVAIERR